nr:2Fe-2S iron-sulfur cluster binding domain-containing protein [Mesotoga infera]
MAQLQILITALVLGGISAVLAAIISVADAVLNNYGDVKLTVNGSKTYTVKGGSTLLTTLAGEKIFIPSACGGKGSCGLCKVKVLSNIGPILPTELPYLAAREKSENIRLSCQVKVKGDISIEIPDELFNIREYVSTVSTIRDLTHDIKEVFFSFDDEINFKAGQYVQLIVPPYGEIKESTMRAYSMSSQPSIKNGVELLVRLVPNGIVTTYVHKYLKEKDEVRLLGPFGDFFLRNTDTDIIFIAGGSGMAPIKSIILDMKEKGIKRNAYYFFGARSKKDLFYLDLMEEIEREMPNFHFIPALSNALPEDNWEGESGLITDVVDRYLARQGEIEREGYLCGSPGMINACITVLGKHGIPENKIYFDKFG